MRNLFMLTLLAIFACSCSEDIHTETDSTKGEQENQTQFTIKCVGNSLTQGQTGLYGVGKEEDYTCHNSYPDILQQMLPDMKVINLGFGGQKLQEIFARNGWLTALTTKRLVLLGNKGKSVLITHPTHPTEITLVDNERGLPISNLFSQGTPEARKQLATAFLNGVECELTYKSSEDKIYINRKEKVPDDQAFDEGSQLVFAGANENDGSIQIIYAGVNNPTSDFTPEQYVDIYQKAVNQIQGGRYLILGYFASIQDVEYIKRVNQAMLDAFGDRFIDSQSYICSDQALKELGITPTKKTDISKERRLHGVRSDEELIADGMKPSSLWRYSWTPKHKDVDYVHNNHYGYLAMATMIKKRLLELGWVR